MTLFRRSCSKALPGSLPVACVSMWYEPFSSYHLGCLDILLEYLMFCMRFSRYDVLCRRLNGECGAFRAWSRNAKHFDRRHKSGDGEIRTLDPLLARQVLSQLSYTPINPGSHLLFHTVSSAVPSAAYVLTIVFGMWTGVSRKRITTGKIFRVSGLSKIGLI